MKLFMLLSFVVVSLSAQATLTLKDGAEICKAVTDLPHFYLYSTKQPVEITEFSKKNQDTFLVQTLTPASDVIPYQFVVKNNKCVVNIEFYGMVANAVVKTLSYADAYPYHVYKIVLSSTNGGKTTDSTYNVKY